MEPNVSAVQTERALGSGGVRPRERTFVRGKGALLWDESDRRFIDCSAAHGTASLGHAHPALTRAIERQAGRLIAATAAFANDQRSAYMSELSSALPEGFERLFLCNSGTESVEAALKFARLATGRTSVVACVRGFHGRTMGALSATHERRYREPFAPLVPGFTHVPYDRIDKLDAAVTGETAAVVLEPVQGEGGVRPASAEYLQAAERICRERGAMFVADEVQTGFGRTGRMFAVERHGVTPDLLCMAKGIASGFPMGAVALGGRVGEIPAGAHGSTFGGNPLACAAARATLTTLLEQRLPERSEALGTWFRDRLSAIESSRVRAVRGVGLMNAIELKERSRPFLDALEERGVIALAAGPNVMRFLPPLVVLREELEEVLCAVSEVLA
ncbi:MAG: aspartate aminotransferase family protein [bacterium]|nr:aspartate aminotransferase family protein [bacterium]